MSALLLLERLTEPERPGAEPLRRHDDAALEASIVRELSRLLDTRSTVALPAGLEPTVLGYGIADLAAVATADDDALARLAEILRRAIVSFEPRLRRPEVRVERVAGAPQRLTARVTGAIGSGAKVLPFAVPIELADTSRAAGG